MKRLKEFGWLNVGLWASSGLLLLVVFAEIGVILIAPRAAHAQGVQQAGIGPMWSCSLDNIGATLTRCQDNPDPAVALIITDIIASSTTATGGEMILRYGDNGGSANCATNTVSVFPASATVVRYGYPGNTAAPAVLQFNSGIKVPAGKDLCVLGIATQTVTIDIRGYKTAN